MFHRLLHKMVAHPPGATARRSWGAQSLTWFLCDVHNHVPSRKSGSLSFTCHFQSDLRITRAESCPCGVHLDFANTHPGLLRPPCGGRRGVWQGQQQSAIRWALLRYSRMFYKWGGSDILSISTLNHYSRILKFVAVILLQKKYGIIWELFPKGGGVPYSQNFE